MTKNLNNHHKELKKAVACVPLKEKNIAQEKSGAMLKNIQKGCKKYVMPIRVNVGKMTHAGVLASNPSVAKL